MRRRVQHAAEPFARRRRSTNAIAILFRYAGEVGILVKYVIKGRAGEDRLVRVVLLDQ